MLVILDVQELQTCFAHLHCATMLGSILNVQPVWIMFCFVLIDNAEAPPKTHEAYRLHTHVLLIDKTKLCCKGIMKP